MPFPAQRGVHGQQRAASSFVRSGSRVTAGKQARSPVAASVAAPSRDTAVPDAMERAASSSSALPEPKADFVMQRTGPPRFHSPWPQPHAGAATAPPSSKPIMIYLPGIDGTGMAAYKQFPSITERFALMALTVPIENRMPFQELAAFCADHVRDLAAATPSETPIYLLGESFGGILALAVAAQCRDAVDRVVLVNPATSYEDSVWPQVQPILASLPPAGYTALPYVLAPVLGNPIAMAAHKVDRSAPPAQQLAELADGLAKQLPSLGKLVEILPQETLLWKLQLLRSGCSYLDTRYHQVAQRVLVLNGDQDVMLPSGEEGAKLEKLLPSCRTKVLPGRSHALLQEAGVDLVQLLQEEGFLVERRVLTGRAATTTGKRLANGFGRAAPIELPTAREFELAERDLGNLRTAYSPVFFSTREDGTVEQGLGNLALKAGEPVILVGNHQTVPLDTGFHVAEIFKRTGVLVRGLTHPSAMGNTPAYSHAAKRPAGAVPLSRSGLAAGRGNRSDGTFGSFLTRWGAVPVGATNLFRLLRDGEAVMLFPGGASEALAGTRTIDKYALYWSPRPEFVRAAARFSATIIPFGAVGCEENVTAVLSARALRSIGSALGAAGARVPQDTRPRINARRGVNELSDGDQNDLDSPLYLPSGLNRYYFLYGKPIRTTPEMAKDKDAAARVYKEARRAVEDSVTYLLEQRERDPFRDPVRRLLHERVTGAQAPTFVPPRDVKL